MLKFICKVDSVVFSDVDQVYSEFHGFSYTSIDNYSLEKVVATLNLFNLIDFWKLETS